MKRNPKDGRLEMKATGHIRHKRMLKKKGWSYRTASPVLGVHFQHLAKVLHGSRDSRTLLRKIEELPAREGVAL
jgi:hypothetical protein